MPEARVGNPARNNNQNNNMVKTYPVYEWVDDFVFCQETGSFKLEKRERQVFSEAEIRFENLGQGTATNDTVRFLVGEENQRSRYYNEAGHEVPTEAGGSGTDPNNIFIQDYTFNRGENKRFDNLYISTLKNYPDAMVRLFHWFEYDNNYSLMKPRSVTKRYEIYRPNPQNNDRLEIVDSFQEKFNNYNDESIGRHRNRN